MYISYYIPEHNVDRLLEKLAEVGRKAKRLGQRPPVVTVTPEPVVVVEERIGKDHDIQGCPTRFVVVRQAWKGVTVQAEPVKVAGEWEFVATLLTTAEGAMTLGRPDLSLPPKYREATNWCDHCRSHRRRQETYVVRRVGSDDVADYRQVGANCLVDFLGDRDAQRLAAWATHLGAFASWCAGEGGGMRAVEQDDLADYLAWTALVIRHEGWMSVGKAKEWEKESTRSRVRRVQEPPSGPGITWRDVQAWERENERLYGAARPTPAEEDRTEAQAALAWALAIDPNTTSDYEHNCLLIAKLGYVTDRVKGIAASIVATMQRQRAKAAEREAERKAQAASTWVGEVGKRQVFAGLTVISLRDIAGDWGNSTLAMFRDTEGNVLKWFATNLPQAIVEGATVSLKATVKKHEEYQGIKQTALTRANLV